MIKMQLTFKGETPLEVMQKVREWAVDFGVAEGYSLPEPAKGPPKTRSYARRKVPVPVAAPEMVLGDVTTYTEEEQADLFAVAPYPDDVLVASTRFIKQHGEAAFKALLGLFGANKARELRAEQHANFIIACDAGLA